MNILVTGAKGMVGTALCNNLKNIRDGKNKTRPALNIEEIFEYDLDSTPAELDEYCQKADFVFNLAGVNRPENPEDFMKGNFGFASDLLNCLKKYGNKATIMLSSSIQATLAGRFGNSEYGRSKKAGEELFNISIMKQEKAVLAPVDGMVKRVLKSADYKTTRKMVPVREGELIVELAPAPSLCPNPDCAKPIPSQGIHFCPWCGHKLDEAGSNPLAN